MKKLKILLSLVVFATSFAGAQDIHFSQFYASPLNLNPALTGLTENDFRATTSYRNQWRSVSANNFKTATAGYDMPFFKEKWNGSFLGGGLSFFNDKAGDAAFRTTQINLSVSYGKALADGKQYFVSGVQAGLVQRSFNFNALTWDNQYDGEKFDPGRPSGEIFAANTFSYPDISAGIAWKLKASDLFGADLGLAAFHLNRPPQSLIGDASEKLYSKIAAHGSLKIGLKNTNIAFLPSFLYMQQGPLREISAGSWIKYVLQDPSKYTGLKKETAVYFGGWYRLGDALAPAFRFDYREFSVGITYDVNLSGLTPASTGRGGLEFSLAWNGSFGSKASAARIQ